MTMKYYPIFLDVKNRRCLVVGAGQVGMRKAENLVRSGAQVTVVSPVFSEKFCQQDARMICKNKPYDDTDLEGMFLVFAATDNAELNCRIQQDARENGLLCNVADAPENSDFLLPSTIEQGDLVIAVSTSGTSPAMARTIKNSLSRQFGPEYAVFLQLMGSLRSRLLAQNHSPDTHKNVFYRLIDNNIIELIKAGDEMKINAILHRVIGEQYCFQDLISPKE